MQLHELWVKLTDAQAAERTENSFRHTVCVPWERPQPSQLPPQPPQPPRYDNKRVHWDDEPAKAKYSRNSGKGGAWSSYEPGGWKKETTWEPDDEPKAYESKWNSWKEEEPQRHHDSQQWKSWPPSTPQKVDEASSYWESSANREHREQAEMREAMANSKQTLQAELAKIEAMEKRMNN